MLVVSMVGFAALAVIAAIRLRGPGRVIIPVGFGILALQPLVLALFFALTRGPLAALIGQNVTWIPGWICVAVGVIRVWRASRPVAAPTPQWR